MNYFILLSLKITFAIQPALLYEFPPNSRITTNYDYLTFTNTSQIFKFNLKSSKTTKIVDYQGDLDQKSSCRQFRPNKQADSECVNRITHYSLSDSFNFICGTNYIQPKCVAQQNNKSISPPTNRYISDLSENDMVVTYDKNILIFKSNSEENSILKFELQNNELNLVLSESNISRVSWISYVEDKENEKIYAFYESLKTGTAHVAQLCISDTGNVMSWVSVFTLSISCNGDKSLSEIKFENGEIYARFENKLCRLSLRSLAKTFKMESTNTDKAVTTFIWKTGGQCDFEDIKDTEHSDSVFMDNLEYSKEHTSLNWK